MNMAATPTHMSEPLPQRQWHLHEIPDETTGAGIEPPDSAPLPATALRMLLAWLSPAFPVGGFSYSHGLEWAIEDGTVADADTLKMWLADILRHGAGWSDGVIFLHGWRAASSRDSLEITEINALAIALQPSKERHLEATAQGRAFLSTVAATWPNDRLAAFAALFEFNAPVAYPVAVALACAAHNIPPAQALNAYLGTFTANLVSAGVRAIPLGQTDGQRIIAALSPLIEKVADSASTATTDMLGGSAWRADIASMKHETQYTRLFRS